MSCLMINDLDAGLGRFGKPFIELMGMLIMLDLDVYYDFSSGATILDLFFVCKDIFAEIKPYLYVID